MQLDLIPTDNLYKFCAILGLSLMVFNTYYNFEMLEKSKIETIKLERESKKFIYDTIMHNEQNIEINKKLAEAIADMQKTSIIGEKYKKAFFEKKASKREFEKLEIDADVAIKYQVIQNRAIDSLIRKINIENKSLNYRAIDLKIQEKLIEQEKSKAEKYSIFLKIGVVLGFLLSVYGFFNWRKIQITFDTKI